MTQNVESVDLANTVSSKLVASKNEGVLQRSLQWRRSKNMQEACSRGRRLSRRGLGAWCCNIVKLLKSHAKDCITIKLETHVANYLINGFFCLDVGKHLVVLAYVASE
jgi:hypothetical protein